MWTSFDLFPQALAGQCDYYYEGYFWDCNTPSSLQTQFEGEAAGSSVSGGYWIPPDTDGSVGTNYVVTFVNGAFYAWTRNGSLYMEVGSGSFWCSHYSNLSNCDPVDPRIVHDNISSRWVASSLLGSNNSANSTTLLAVSPGEDPTSPAAWYFYSVPSCSDGSQGDQPRLALDGNWIFLTVDCFVDFDSSGVEENSLWVFDKASLYAGDPLKMLTNAFLFNAGGNPVAAALSENYLAAPDTGVVLGINDPVISCSGTPCFKSGAFNSIQIGMVSGTGNGPFWTPDCAVVKLPSSAAVRTPAGAQLGSQDLVGVKTVAKIQSAVLQTMPPFNFVYTYFAFEEGLPVTTAARSAIRWAQIDSLGNLVQSGLIQDTTNVKSYHFPSIAVDGGGYGVLGYADFSKNYYPRGDYQVFDFSLGVTSNGEQSYAPDDDLNFTPQQVLINSQGPWEGNTCKCDKYECVGGNYNCVRWGDYSSTVIDPGGTTIWTLQEYINNTPTPPPAAMQSGGVTPAATPSPGPSDIQDTWWGQIAE